MIQTKQYREISELANAHGASLVIVSKTRPQEDVLAFYKLGHRDFAENRVQELEMKKANLPSDIRWHFIGHIQTKKARQVVQLADVIHSIDTEKLLLELAKESEKQQKKVLGFLQFHIAEESTKSGFSMEDIPAFLPNFLSEKHAYLQIEGVMGMATFTENESQIRAEFEELASIFKALSKGYFANKEHFKEISMGMSGDYALALQCGSTMLRVGSILFEQ